MLDGRHVEEEAWLQKEMQKVAREKELLEEERRSFSEAAIRLNREVSSGVLLQVRVCVPLFCL